jgi:hypothetical protein
MNIEFCELLSPLLIDWPLILLAAGRVSIEQSFVLSYKLLRPCDLLKGLASGPAQDYKLL